MKGDVKRSVGRAWDSVAGVVGVIDLGTTAIRMSVAELSEEGEIVELDSLQQPLSLGRDSFLRREISREHTEECVRILCQFADALREYGVTDFSKVRAVATTAVREARNREAFLDRVFIATGIEVEVIDEAEVTRLNYRSLQALLRKDMAGEGGLSVVVEIGAGSTEVLVLEAGTVVYSHTFRLGSLRLRAMLDGRGPIDERKQELLLSYIEREFAPLTDLGVLKEGCLLMALGGDVLFASKQLLPSTLPSEVSRIPYAGFDSFVDDILGCSVDELVRRYRLSLPDAETVGPALLATRHLASLCGSGMLMGVEAHLRDGLLAEMADRGSWSEGFVRQIILSAKDLGRKYDFNGEHAEQVAFLSQELFVFLEAQHTLTTRYRVILEVAALLHEVGLFINNRSMHKHSMYLIQNSELFGLGKKDLLLVSLVARYHRGAAPRMSHAGWGDLPREERVAVSKMAALLRIADALDRSHSRRVTRLDCRLKGGRLVLCIPRIEDLALKRLAVSEKSALFEEVFGLKVRLQTEGKGVSS